MDKNSSIPAREGGNGVAGPAEGGQRLDAFLTAIFPELGLRGRRRLCSSGRVRVDGKIVRPGERLRPGQNISWSQEPLNTPPEGFRLVWANGGYCAFSKPAGLPSARLAGGLNGSAEACLESLWPRLAADFTGYSGQPLPENAPLLCNRLDAPTSGLLLGAFSRAALQDYRRLELEGRIEKYYYALVWGEAPESLRLEQALDTDSRRKTRVLEHKEEDRTRHTLAEKPSSPATMDFVGHQEPVSLLRTLIRRGARHQIRAHLTWAGFPIVGDHLYAPDKNPNPEAPLYLHHFRIRFMGMETETPLPWEFSQDC